MINPDLLLKVLKKNQINFITGVPDSMFKSVCFTFEKKIQKKSHISAANEGAAIGLAVGYHLATNRVPLVYFQNSGIGNAMNPLISLVNKNIYKIPMLLLIGWRGEVKGKKQIKDEPQHSYQGKITVKQLELLGISHIKVDYKTNIKDLIKKAKYLAIKKSQPIALLVRKNSFDKNFLKNTSNRLSREYFLKEICKHLPKSLPKISTTGMLSRELYEINKFNKKSHNTFMCVGGMGHASSIAVGVAKTSKKKVICLDGDGSVIMHMGSLVTAAKCKNMIHILFNNNSHDSVGGQMTAGDNLNFSKIAKSVGYAKVFKISKLNKLPKIIKESLKSKNNSFIEIICGTGHRNNLLRPGEPPIFNKKQFMKNLGSI
jgi:phosphonopyruvate decarboxylase